MKLYKNVDLVDLNNILNQGILPISKTGNDNWDDYKRVENSKECVYLFKPLTEQNAFPKYGMVLLEVEVNNAKKNKLEDYDANIGKYDEYICEEVAPENIKNVYVPEIFKERIIEEGLFNERMIFVKINAKTYSENGLIEATEKVLKRFAETSPLNTDVCNFFRGINENRIMIDLYDVSYKI